MKVLEVLLKHGKITQEQYEAAKDKSAAVENAKAEYKAKKASLTKAQLQGILDVLVTK